MRQILWILDYRRDLAADFRAIYRLSPREASTLPGPEYLALAYRVDAYQGVMSARRQQAQESERHNVKPGTRMTHERDGAFRDLIDFG